jgi:hypothetical protein
MKRQLGCLSPTGLLVALVVTVVIGGYTFLHGGVLFSPGPLTAVGSGDIALDGFRSHAEFEGQCTHCHRPWHGADPSRCVSCHANVRDQITSRHGLHGLLQEPDVCTQCHTEHQGREADISAAALPSFPHQRVGFSLARHRRHAAGRSFICADCHAGSDYAFAETLCEDCHAELDVSFMSQHVADFSWDCLVCHDGSGAMAEFDHNTVFLLEGAHASVDCVDCHTNSTYKGMTSDCVACHEEPDVHLDQFGTDCAACHTAQAWAPARLLQHAFPLDHGSRAEVECQVCHPANYVAYTCYDCHEHDAGEVERKHSEEGISDFAECVECHPTGREGEGAHGAPEDD